MDSHQQTNNEESHENPKEIVLSPGDESQQELTEPISHLINQFVENVEKKQHTNFTPIHVDEIASRVAKFYELIRKVVDWKEDNVLRRSAIERILKRLIFTKIAGLSFAHGLDENNVAEIVTSDLIRGGHLPNNEIPREIMPRLVVSLQKYFYILENTKFPDTDPLVIKRKINFYTFIIEIAACEIEEILTNPFKENLILLTMSQISNELIHLVPDDAMTNEEKYTQVYIAVCRSLFDLDDSYITYQLLKYQYNEWLNPTPEFRQQIQKQVFALWNETEQILNHPLGKDFKRICEKIDTVFTLICDYLDEYKNSPTDVAGIIKKKTTFINKIGQYYDKRYQTLKKRLFKYAIFSTLSVFLSNGFTFFIIEVPAASLFAEGFSLFTTLVDFIVPSVIMFILISIIRPPTDSNRQQVLNLTVNFVYGGNKQYTEIFAHKKRNRFLMFIIGLLYLILTLLTFLFVGSVFYYAKLPITSVFFDTFTIALTIFAAVMIRNKSKELSVDDKTHVWDFFLDMVSVPVAKIGSFLAAKWKEYNIIAILFNFLIETPFAFLLDFIENWSQYLKERRAELH